MARPRQVKKNRSSRSRVKTGNVGRTKAGKKKVNFLGNETIRENWDHKLTLTQNYERLGLSVKLNGRTGGVEKNKYLGDDSLAISTGIKAGKILPGEVKVVRDADGNIVEIIESEGRRKRDNPLHDPLNDLEDDSELDENIGEDGPSTRTPNPIVAKLEAQAAAEAEELEQQKKPRKQSSREEEWIGKLVNKYGDDYAGMFRDRKLNPMQQSEGDIKKRVKKWRAKHET